MEPPPVDTAIDDGRTRRRLRTYELAVDAVLDLIQEEHAPPTAQQVAERSGISIRTIFRLTEDIDSLRAAAIARQSARVRSLFVTLPHEGPLDSRIDALVANRSTIFEAVAPVRRIAESVATTSQLVAEQLADNRRLFRSQVRTCFGSELLAVSSQLRAEMLEAADIAASWETWDQLRRVKGLSKPRSEQVVRRLLVGALSTELDCIQSCTGLDTST